MGRIRTIKPEFPQSESMGRVSRESRLCFILLWTASDDSGRLRGNSRMLASTLYPYDEDAGSLMDGWLGELEREGCIKRYHIDGSTYVEISKWLSHQKIDKPSQSRFPAFVESSRIIANPREPSSGDLGPRTLDLGPRNGMEQGPIAPTALPARPRKSAAKPNGEAKTAATWSAYSLAYKERYGVDPVDNAVQRGKLAHFVKRVGNEESPGVARDYLNNRNGLYVASKHCIDLLLRDCEKLRTEWATGNVTYQRDASEVDRLGSTGAMWKRVAAKLEAKGIK
jgi:hypothetical protein